MAVICVEEMREVLSETATGRDFYLCLGDFLDAFYRADDARRVDMVAAAPDTQPQSEYLAFAAATVHKLCNDNNLTPPDWVFEERFYLRDNPFFACNAKGNLRLLFMYKSPAEFKHRNLFVDENVLKRV